MNAKKRRRIAKARQLAGPNMHARAKQRLAVWQNGMNAEPRALPRARLDRYGTALVPTRASVKPASVKPASPVPVDVATEDAETVASMTMLAYTSAYVRIKTEVYSHICRSTTAYDYAVAVTK